MTISSSFSSNVTVETLVVAGGGGGGTNYNLRGAGGGAGGLVYIGNLQIPAGTTANVIVGSGGLVSARGGDSAILPYVPTYSHWFNGYSTYDYLTATPTNTSSTSAAGSLQLNGTTQYLTVTDASAFQFGTNPFTIEGWYYFPTVPANNGLWQLAATNFPLTAGLALSYVTGAWQVGYGAASIATGLAAGTVSANTWVHVAVVRNSGNVLMLYVNGIRYTAVISDTTNYTTTTNLVIGGYYTTGYLMTGYISNFRIVKGTALYDINFTPSPPLSNVTDTKLLLLVASDANKVIDSSSTPLTVTNVGGATFSGTVVPTRVTLPGTNDVTTSAAGSLSFNGTTQYLSITGTTSGPLDLAAGAGNWTVELWVYPRSVTGEQVFFWKGGLANTTNPSYAAFMSGSGGQFIVGDGAAAGANINFPGGTFAINTWHHFALVRSGTSFTAWVNGAIAGTPFTTAFTMSNTGNNGLTIGSSVADGSTRYFNGLITNFRIVKGTAVYTAAFKPQVPLGIVTGTSLLLSIKSDANKLVDASVNNTVVNNVNTATFSATVPSVVSSVYPLTFFFNDFTVEAWIYLNAYGATATGIIETRTGALNQPWAFGLNGTSLDFYWGTGTTTRATSSMRVPTGQWTHVAATRLNGNVYLYINGYQDVTSVASASGAGANIAQTSNSIWIGNYRDGAATGQNTYSANVYISNLRTVNGTAVYTANFTPQTTNLSNIAGTTMLTLQNNTPVDNGPYQIPIVKYYGSVSPSIFTQSTPVTDGYASVYFNGATLLQYTNSTALTTVPAVDASVNQFTVTSTASIPSTIAAAPAITPLSTVNSISFAGSQYLTVAANAAFAYGTGSFTVECWVYITTALAAGAFVGPWTGTAATSSWVFTQGSPTATNLRFGVSDGTTATFYQGGGGLSINTWIHVAAVRNGTTLTLYSNGTSVSTNAGVSANISVASQALQINGIAGATFLTTGYISNLRIVKGTAVYTGNFTVPTAPLTITQSSSGANIAAITGSQTSLLLRPVAGWTAECWVNPTGDYGTYRTVFAKRVTTSATTEFEGYLRTGTGVISFYNSTNYESTTVLTANTWSHCVWVYTGTNITIYVNGVQVYTSAVTITTNTEPIIIGGARGYTEYFAGYLSNFRFTRGQVYTGNFTPPTRPFAATQTASGNIAAITGNIDNRTNLLVLQSNTYKDNSANNYLYGYTYTINTGTPLIKIDVTPFVDPVRGVIAYGGGAGAFNNTTNNANTGGSGGGSWSPGYVGAPASQPSTSYYAGTAYTNTGFGNTGGLGGGVQPYGGGGGGAGGVGSGYTDIYAGGGGIGRQYSISGLPAYYAGGGSSAAYPLDAGYLINAGGLGGGGQGDNSVWAATQVTGYTGSTGTVNATANGTPYTGGGGGSGGYGGSGIVVMRYLGTQIATGGTVTSIGGYTIHTFTTAGTFTIAANISIGSAGGNGGPYAGGGGGAGGYSGFGGNGAAGSSLAAGSYGIGGGAGGGGSSATFGGGGGGVDIWGLGGYSGAGGAAGQPGTGGSPEVMLGITGNGAQPGFGSNGGLYGGGGGGGVTSSLDTSQGWGANGAFALIYSTTSSTYTYPYISPLNLVYLGNLQSTNTTAIGSNVDVIVLDDHIDQQVYNTLGYGPTNAKSNIVYEYPTNNNTALVTIVRAPVAGNNIVGSTDINITVNYQAEWMLRNSDPAFPATYDKPFNYQYAQPITTTNDPRKLTLKATYITKTGTQDDSTEPDQYL